MFETIPMAATLRCRSTAPHLLILWVRIPQVYGSFLFWFLCFVRESFCNELITRPEESYRMWCVVVCDLETLWMRNPWPNGGWFIKNKEFVVLCRIRPTLSVAVDIVCNCTVSFFKENIYYFFRYKLFLMC
jgi:hypothetical protein